MTKAQKEKSEKRLRKIAEGRELNKEILRIVREEIINLDKTAV